MKHYKQSTYYTCAACCIMEANDVEPTREKEMQIWKYINNIFPVVGSSPIRMLNYIRTYTKAKLHLPKRVPYEKLPKKFRWLYKIIIGLYYLSKKTKDHITIDIDLNDILSHAVNKSVMMLVVRKNNLHYILVRPSFRSVIIYDSLEEQIEEITRKEFLEKYTKLDMNMYLVIG